MAQCQTCGNNYDKCFELIMDSRTYVFDCFECAIHKLAPICEHCHCKIIGHGVEANSRYFCCAHCAENAGEEGMKDRK